ncbi:MAG: IS200/IS605 family transposase [Thermomicrobiales bacterium]
MTWWRLFYHLVWTTKYREPVIDQQIESIVRRTVYGIADDHNAKVWAIGMMPDHVHVAISVPPKYSIAEVLNALKGTSSHLLGHELQRAEHPWPGWQREYGVNSFSERSLQTVVDYVNHQPERHATRRLIDDYERIERDGFNDVSHLDSREKEGSFA